jgi:hypothetical protein
MKRNRLTERDLSRIVKRVVNEDKPFSEMGKKKSSAIEYVEVFDAVINALEESGEYNESMDYAAEGLAWDIFDNMRDNLAYVSENYEEEISQIIDQYSDDYADEGEYEDEEF